ncbi:phosphotransferase family protein [Mycolicibacterium sp. XJ2546]
MHHQLTAHEASPALRQWIFEVTDLEDLRFSRPEPIGRSRNIWIVSGRNSTGDSVEYVARQETGRGTFTGTAFTLRREAAILTALQGSAVPTPDVTAVSEDGNTILITRLPGTAAFEFVDDVARARTIDNFIAAIVELHEIDPAVLGTELEQPTTVAEHALLDLRHHQRSFEIFGSGEPVLRRAFDWLHQYIPAHVQRTALLQGDTGPGNFLHLDTEITGLIDWEASHVGDPMDDLAWIWFRKCFLRKDDDLVEWYARYARVSGLRIDYDSICYYRVLVLVRAAVATIVRSAHNPGVEDPKPARMTRLVEAVLRDPYGRGGATDALAPIITTEDRNRLEELSP